MRRLTLALSVIALLVAGTAAGAERDAADPPEALRAVEVAGAQFRVTTASGRVLPQQELVGAVLSYRQGDQIFPVRIDRVFADPKDPTGELLRYGFSVRDPAGDAWNEMCQGRGPTRSALESPTSPQPSPPPGGGEGARRSALPALMTHPPAIVGTSLDYA